MENIIILVVVIFALYLVISKYQRKKRRAYLIGKYGDEYIVDLIVKRSFWQGQTGEQLIYSLGSPASVDRKVLKNKIKEVWKYQKMGKGRYRLRVTLDNDIVIGWEQKSS